MSYLQFDKTQLVNLEYSLSREILLSNSSGVYSSTSLVGCNTRKYHGLLVAPVPSIDGGRHVLLSTIHETIIQHGQDFNLGINKYPGEYNPKGHKYARWFEIDPLPRIVYRVGGVVIQKELLLTGDEARIMVRYTLLEAASRTWIRIKPFLAFRGIHKLSKSNMWANQKVSEIPNGVKLRLYKEYPFLYMQTSRKSEFITAPDWYLNVEYSREQLRGYDFHEDLFVPGYFEMEIKKGQSIIITAGLDQATPSTLSKKFAATAEMIPARENFYDWLKFAAHGSIRKTGNDLDIVPGYHWFGRWGRHSIIPLPGFASAIEDREFPLKVLDFLARKMRDGILPDHSPNINEPVYGSADTSLWFIWALQELEELGHEIKSLYQRYRGPVRSILSAYINGKIEGVEIHDNGLVHAFMPGKALTWMDSYVDGNPVTQRPGYAIEVNGLWYNALSFAIRGAEAAGYGDDAIQWEEILAKLGINMVNIFWDESNNRLFDYVFEGVPNTDVRPNAIIAASMRNTPLSEEQIKYVVDQVKQELLVPKGIRSLSPRSDDFKPAFEGAHHDRDLAYHQGTVWPWLSGAFARAWLGIYGKSGITVIEKLYNNFQEDLTIHGIGLIPEVYDGNPPHRPCGAISYSSSVGELLMIKKMLSKF
jgi:predicted glycogen debranching enzyme